VTSTSLFELFPSLEGQVGRVSLGALPTPVEDATRVFSACGRSGELWLKRDDLSSPIYGGNKLRLLEHALATARDRGVTHVYSSGAIGSNFAVATALHAPRLGLTPGAICFPQPLTAAAELNHEVVKARATVVEIQHWSLLPLASELVRRRAAERGERAEVLSQVALSPDALLGYLAAGLELARQIARGDCPAPARVVLPIGSAATTSGVLAGLSLARKLGLFRAEPRLVAVRIAAWPLSRRARVLKLAGQALARVAELTGKAEYGLGKHELLPVSIVTDQLGPGYGRPTPAASAARAVFAAAGWALLDDTYTAKAAAHVLSTNEVADGPSVLWCTKSSAPLP
jgi:1-aminocyclopropane-1-carboxylate deaminase/D-cysteine desulfhydrase-like pyridoxal-dependent ACC family enzyme